MTNRIRCAWAEDDPLMSAYHDEEWGVPLRDSRMLWEMLMLEGFQAGLAWITVLRKREAFRKAFAGFNPRIISRFGEARVLRLMADAGIIRARAKIAATIQGAQIYCDMEERGERYDAVCLLQPTSPLREADEIDACIAMLAAGESTAVMTVRRITATGRSRRRRSASGTCSPTSAPSSPGRKPV